jgi:beta-N-acetylhexosaminidase
VVLALNAPYYLDTTEINKLDAYLCAYGKTPPFIETAVRALFGEAPAGGASPVSIEGSGYELAVRLSPDPDQPLDVQLLDELPENPLPPVAVRVGVGPVLDRNAHPVPDGTTVTVTASNGEGAAPVVLGTLATVRGMAKMSFTLSEPGRVEIVAQSGEASSQRPLVVVVAAPPTPTPTVTPTPTPTVRPSPMPSATPTASATPAPTSTPTPTPTATAVPLEGTDEGTQAGALRPVDGLDLLAALSAILLAGVVAFSTRRRPGRSPSRQARLALLVLIGGLLGYLLYATGWLRPEVWLVSGAESRVAAGRLTAAALAFVFGLASLALERPLRQEMVEGRR